MARSSALSRATGSPVMGQQPLLLRSHRSRFACGVEGKGDPTKSRGLEAPSGQILIELYSALSGSALRWSGYVATIPASC